MFSLCDPIFGGNIDDEGAVVPPIETSSRLDILPGGGNNGALG
jgi:hypothetical protein